MSNWRNRKAAAKYYNVCNRTLTKWLENGFPHSRSPTGQVLIDVEAGDEHLREQAQGDKDVINEVLDRVR